MTRAALPILVLLLATLARAGSPTRGVAILSSNVGRDVTADEIVTFARACRLNLVVIDFAWITHHWPRTDLDAIRPLAARLRDGGVRVAAMYRPRLLRPTDAAVRVAVTANGTAAPHHNDLCFADDDSAAWAARWGADLLTQIPAIEEIILYNLLPTCACPSCRDGRATAHIASFLRLCRRTWSPLRRDLRIGHVAVGTPHAPLIDNPYPFLPVMPQPVRDADVPVAGTPFLKTCWADQTDNDAADVARALAACDARGSGFVLWYYDWLFRPGPRAPKYDRRTLVEALHGDWPTLDPIFNDTPPTTKEIR
jgi:hypothetical protein